MAQTNAKNEHVLEIDRLSYGPYGISHLDGKAVMIPYTVPGDRVAARIIESKERYAIGELLRLIEPSPHRQVPPCRYFSDCGGCPWQQVGYEAQLKAKQQSVEDALRRIGKLENFETRPILPSPLDRHYRRRIRLQCRKENRLGFFRAGSHDLIEIDHCLIADNALNRRLEVLREWINELVTPLEHIEIVTGDEPDQVVAVAKANSPWAARDDGLCERLVGQNGGLAGLVLDDGNRRRTWGQTMISVRVEKDVCLTVDGDVFTQINPAGNEKMVSALLAAGEFDSRDRVLELYSGAGNFTLSIAKRAREVVAVEAYGPAIESGKRSAQSNGIDNIHWTTAHVPAAVDRLKKRGEKFSKIVLDPPRPGAKGIQRDVAAFGAEKIAYVSCNPATLARDLAELAKHGYRLEMVQPVDLFPHTFHVEALAIMTRS
jgi:23S rRNA (uracil1939-C5)-methyltransferase